MAEPLKPVWRPVLGRLTASQTHTLRTGSQSRAGAESEERSDYRRAAAPERSDPLTVRPEGVGGVGPSERPERSEVHQAERSDDQPSAARSNDEWRRRRLRFNPLLTPVRRTDPDHPGRHRVTGSDSAEIRLSRFSPGT